MTITHRANETAIARKDWKFGCMDRLGREIGCCAVLAEADYVATDAKYGRSVAPGHYFEARVQATRSGKAYGPRQDERLFATRAEAEAYINARVEASAKAAKKQVA